MFDLHNNCKVLADYCGRTTDNTALVASCDRMGFNGVQFFAVAGTIADADVSFTVLVEDSADNSAWAAVSDDFLLGTEAGAVHLFSDDNETAKIGYVGKKRYVRMTITPANNTGNLDMALVALGHNPIVAPQTTQVL